MPRRRSSRRQAKYQIRDRWAEKRREVGMQWMARVWEEVEQNYKSKCFETKEEAECWAKEKAHQFGLGLDSSRHRNLDTLSKLYLEYLAGRNRAARHLQQIKQCFREMGVAGITDLCSEDICMQIERWLRKLTSHHGKEKEATPQHKNRFLGFAQALTRWSVKRHLIPLNRLEAIDPFKEPKPMKEVYTVEELQRLLAPERKSEDMFLYIALLVYLGCRPTEAKVLTWKSIDWKTSTVNFPADLAGNKLRRGYAVPLPPELEEILVGREKVGAVPIIAEKYAKASTHHALHDAVLRYLGDCSVEPRGMPRHAFRNTCASLLTAIGVPWVEIRSLLNHEDLRISADYSRCSVQFRKAVKNWPKDNTFWIRRPLPEIGSESKQSEL